MALADFPYLLETWRERAIPARNALVEAIRAEAAAALREAPGGDLRSALDRLREPAAAAVRRAWRETLIPDCLAWLELQGILAAPPSRPTLPGLPAMPESEAAYQALEPVVWPALTAVAPPAGLRGGFWALWAGLGALAGGLALNLIARWLDDPGRTIVLIGAVAGAAGLVRGVAALIERRSGEESRASLLGRIAARFRAPAGSVPLAVRLAALAPQIEALADRAVDLALVGCWGLRCAVPSGSDGEPPPREREPLGALDALGMVHALAHRPDPDPAAVLEAAAEALQRFEDDGYRWETVPDGTPYDPAALSDRFDAWGVIAPGQPVFTRKAALLRQGLLIRRGILARERRG